MRQKISFDKNWKFHRGEIDTPFPVSKSAAYMQAKTEHAKWGPASIFYNDSAENYVPGTPICTDEWQTVSLPHDFIIEQTPDQQNNCALGYFRYENAWYRNRFSLSEGDRGKRIALYFEGVATHATVYVNGCLMKHNFCGYVSFEVDVTDVVRFDADNLVAVYVETTDHEGWWYSGGGIYRSVWLIKTAPVSVDLWGVYLHPERQDHENWLVPVETTLRNDKLSAVRAEILTTLVGPGGNPAASARGELTVAAKGKDVLLQAIPVKNPELWDMESPCLYTARTQVFLDGEEADCVETRFGFRTIRFDAERGFFLNGRSVKIQGVCCHQDYGLTGKAVPGRVQRYRLQLLKEMGASGFRTSHYPHSETTMDALDEMGFLVMDETRWFSSTEEGLAQLEMLVKRDRNRPGVILWSIANEEPHQLTDVGRRISETMKAFVKKLDRTRPVTAAISNDPLSAEATGVYDVIGVNYNLAQFDDIHRKYPAHPVFSSECCATGTTRGWYLPDAPERGYISAYDHDSSKSFLSREKTWRFIMEREWLFGGYQWTGIEHRGETVWPRLCSQSGALDLYLQRKDAFYQNQSLWTKEPMIHLLPHWNLFGREGETVSVRAYTNCEEAELFQDGVSLGVRKIRPYGHAEWKVSFQPGKLVAVWNRLLRFTRMVQ